MYLHRNALTENFLKDLFEGLDSLNHLDPLITTTFTTISTCPPASSTTCSTRWGAVFTFVTGITASYIGSLNTGGSVKLAVDSPGQQAPEGATVRVGVSLNLPSPVAIRVPYTIGLGRGLGGLEGFSPSPERGLLFRAGETHREIAFTVPEQAGAQGPRRVVLTLGKTSEIGIRRSDGRGP